MSTLDLSRLPAPIVLEPLDFETLYQEALTDFRALMGKNWSAPLESEPVVKLLEKRAYDKMMERARINDAAKALLLAFARGSDVDHLAANYNVKRLTVVEAGRAIAWPPSSVPWRGVTAGSRPVRWPRSCSGLTSWVNLTLTLLPAWPGCTTARPRSLTAS